MKKVLTIAGFDGSGGAGIQADLKTFCALGCYGATVLTAIPVQNTTGVRSIYEIPARCIEEQLEAILDDMEIDAIKIGMLHRVDIIDAVSKILHRFPANNLVLDPVMIAKSGDRLLSYGCIAKLQKVLFPITTVLTPNIPETSQLLGRKIETKADMQKAAIELTKMGPQAVIVKGGHLSTSCDDCLCIRKQDLEIHWLEGNRIKTKNTHGTGCTFSAAIAAFLAKGLPLHEAAFHAKAYLTKAIESGASLQIGKGNGPVNHLWRTC